MSDYQFNDADAVAWRKSTFAEGIEVKDLGAANGRSMQLVRFAPGASFPLHRHEGPEFIYVLEGIAFQEGQQLSAGWAAVAATGTMDLDFHSPHGLHILNCLHPLISEENEMATRGKILVLVSSGYGLPLKDGKVYTGAGYYLNELTVPTRALMKEGYEITFANPKGNTPQLDLHSAVPDFFGGDEARLQDYFKFRDSLTGLKNPTRISDVIASGLDQYDAVFVPGGHGPMIDLLDDPDAGTVMRHFHETSKPTAVLCHGPISLLSALPNSTEVVAALAAGDADGAHAKAQGWIYAGYKMTIFSTAEEQQREPLEIGGKVLFYPDFALRTAGGDVSVLAPWQSYALQDRELISGQNPFSDQALLKLLLPALEARKK